VKWYRITGKKFFIGVGLLLFLVAAFLVTEHVRGRVAWNRWEAQMRARGERLTIRELVAPTPLPDDNAAMVINGVMLGGTLVPQNLPASMRLVAPGKAAAVVSQGHWFAGQGVGKTFLTTNAALADARRSATPSRRGRGTNASADPTNTAPFTIVGRAELGAEITAVSNALATLREGLRRPGLDYGVEYSTGFSTLLPHLTRSRTFVQWLRAASLHSLLGTNRDASAESLRAMAALVHLETNGVLMIEQLVRIACLHIGLSATWEALQADGWTDAQLAVLQNAWRDDHVMASLARCFEGERAIGLAEIDRIAAGGYDQWVTMMGMGAGLPATVPTSTGDLFDSVSELPKQAGAAFMRLVFFPVWSFAWKDQDKLRLARFWQSGIDAGRRQDKQWNWQSVKVSFEADSAKVQQSKYDPEFDDGRTQLRVFDRIRFLVSSFLTGSDERVLQKGLNMQALRALTETAIAIRRWQVRHGALPASLQELTPELLPAVPIDPLDGKPLRYKPGTNGMFLLYSVGYDFKDDGGDAQPEKNSTTFAFERGRDLVWPMPATREEIEAFEIKKR
jgi:hypothetical protein